MTINEHLSTFHDLDVVTFPLKTAEAWQPPAEPVAWRLAIEPWDGEESFPELWDRFMSTVDPSTVKALVIGQWGEPGEGVRVTIVIERILAAQEKFSALTGIFLGDMIFEENEISWIEQSDVTALLENLPGLTEVGIRGGDELEWKPVRHNNLQRLVIETGGLPREVVSGVAQSDLPALRELRLWLGVDEYGGNWRPEDLQPLLDGEKLPSLRVLGLQNSDKQDKVCELVASAAIVRQVQQLDLSLGILTDAGAQHLLKLTHLTELDLHHHYISEEMQQQLRSALEPAGVRVNLDDHKEPQFYDQDSEAYYYTAVSE
ncbi:STM4015 family protein [Kibdelosporangium philippinense]|uniref:STM4015 family protein n=1 Tax=Kibdelosporangium philippinense TaxID=211113 RepID=A0ABS8Z581_9PSEU|nr:STM4015 family protein [Kibdelosporangium philippinense]MCE7002587.1 STM4015 family protein [Kibdelosporangium philippinense]